MKWFRRVLSSAVIAAGYTVLLGAGLFLVAVKGTGILELPSYYRENSVSPVFVCGGAAVFAGLLAGLFSWVRTQLDVQTAVHMQNMIRTDVSAATAVTPDPGPARPEYVPPREPARPEYAAPQPPSRPEYIQPKAPSCPEYVLPKAPSRPEYVPPRTPSRPEYAAPQPPSRPDDFRERPVSALSGGTPASAPEISPKKQPEKQPQKTDRWERGKVVLHEEDEDED